MKFEKFLDSRSENFKEYFKYTLEYLYKHDKRLKIVNRRNVTVNDCKCSGWCDGDQIVVAEKNPYFEMVYAHEFSHMQQAVEKIEAWDLYDKKFWDNLAKSKIDIRNWNDLMTIIDLERDCENRTLKTSKKWDLFDNEEYAKTANLYLYYYQFVFLQKKWYNTASIYHPVLIDCMPTKLLPTEQFYKIDMRMMRLFYECLDRRGKFYKKLT